MSVHTVRSGDTLSRLAQKYNTTVEKLARANNISNPNLIQVGQQLVIPDGFDAGPSRPASGPQGDSFEAGPTRDTTAQRYDGSRPAPGTTNTDAWIPVNAPMQGDPSARGGSTYADVINQFAVGSNPRYQPRGGATYCNIFAWDVTRAMGAEIPHWVDGNGNPAAVGRGRELDANNGHLWLQQHGPRFGWREVSAEEAQRLANQGHPAVASWRNPGGIGHIAVVRPGEVTAAGPAIAQAGSRNFNDGHVRDSFGNRPVQYFVNDRGTTAPGQQPQAPAPRTYTVQPGDTLSGIAARHGTTWQAIAQANNLGNPNLIQPGQRLTIPGSGSAPAPAPTTPTPAPSTPTPAGALSMEPNHRFTLQELMPHLERYANQYGFDPQVLAGMVYQESSFTNFIVHRDGTGHGLLGYDDNGLAPDFQAWVRRSKPGYEDFTIGRGANARVLPPEFQLEYAAMKLADYSRRYGGDYAAARAWHRGPGGMNDSRGQHYEQLIRAHVNNLF
jgi:LysM repeat protein